MVLGVECMGGEERGVVGSSDIRTTYRFFFYVYKVLRKINDNWMFNRKNWDR